MTDKELKKLSRLELLELLLAESRENERLRAELEKIKQENAIKKSVKYLNETSETLDETTEKLSAALKQASLIINGLDKISQAKAGNEEDLSDGENQQEQIIDDAKDSDDEIYGQDEISMQIDAVLQQISSRIKELDKLAGIVNSDEVDFSVYGADEQTSDS